MSAGAAVLLFQVGPRLYATPVAAVARIDGAGAAGEAPGPLGSPYAPARRLMVDDGRGALAPFAVDAVLGIQRIPADDLRPLPPLCEGLVAPGVTGLVLWQGAPTPLVDLSTLVHRPAAPPPAGRRRDG
ncbi:MAG: chemotaxis protein CheW [Deltaproteobacteria bacterium]|nr:chemotaxis protein CheW [Deltaproteobacteria bacterium]